MVSLNDIREAFIKQGTDKGPLRHGYHHMYHEVFKLMGAPNKLLEVGIAQGRSLAAWSNLFPEAIIDGVDIEEPKFRGIDTKHARLLRGDTTKESIVEIVDHNYDIIIDDGCHTPEAIQTTFDNLRSCWSKIYVIEDIAGPEHVERIRMHLRKRGFRRIDQYSSKEKSTFFLQTDPSSEIRTVLAFQSALVVHPRAIVSS